MYFFMYIYLYLCNDVVRKQTAFYDHLKSWVFRKEVKFMVIFAQVCSPRH